MILAHPIRDQFYWKTLVYNSRFVALTLCSAFILASRSQAQFEGIVVSRNITTDEMGRQQQFVMTMWIKKDMVRIETNGGSNPGSTMLYRTDMRKIFMLNNDEKTYFEISQDEKPEQLYSADAGTMKFTTRKTGKVKTIAGYVCEQFIIKRGGEETEVWGTKKLAHLVSAISKALGQDHAGEGAANELMKKGLYPLRSSTKIDGVLIESQEVTSIETKSLEAALFSLPTDYKKQKTVDMVPGLQDSKK